MALVPLLRLAKMRAEGASRAAPMPAPPGTASLGLAVSAAALQARSSRAASLTDECGLRPAT